MKLTDKQFNEIQSRLGELIKIKKILPDLVNDLGWEFERMSSSGQKTLNKIAKIIGCPPFSWKKDLTMFSEHGIVIRKQEKEREN